jgi:hypothetical protein
MKTTTCNDVADYVWLTGHEARAMLTELAGDEAPLHSLVSKLRGRVSAERTHLLLEQVELRRRAKAKFVHPEQMFFTRIGLEQATDEWVAAYKALRFAARAGNPAPDKTGCPVPASSPSAVADVCCGIGGDLSALAKNSPVVGVDRDKQSAHFAAVNSGASTLSIDVEQFNLSGITALHIDPDRRPTGDRTTSLELTEPNLATIETLISRVPDAAVKLAPATRVPADWSNRCELEWISRDRECRQQVAWHGALADFPGQHRATIVPTACGIAARTIIGRPNQPVPVTTQIDHYVFDIDSAVLAAHLRGTLASQHALTGLGNGATYLTGPQPIDDTALACFEVADILPLEPRKLARYLARRRIGRLEIKKRGVDIDPEKLRRELKPKGDNAAALLITRAGGRIIVIVAARSV